MNNAIFTPTAEQQAALEMAMTGNSFKVVAYAGAGKTSTLKLISRHKNGRGLYLAFNKAIATEAANSFTPNVRCQTFHSLAYRHVPRNITAKISLPKLTTKLIADELKLKPINITRTIGNTKKQIWFSPTRLAMIINDSLVNFCKTHAKEPAPRHIILPSWLSNHDAIGLQNTLYPALVERWQQSIDPRHPAGIGHDIYLKLWTLSNPTIPADFVLFDEAQDADPLMMGALINQPCQTIYVGDAHQQIYEWRGAVNAMKNLPLPETKLTQSFRFGEPIADIANLFLKALQESTPLRGNPNQNSMVSDVAPQSIKSMNAVLCRTNAAAMTVLMRGLKLGHKVALQADSDRILRFCEGAECLKAGKSTHKLPELAFFNQWREVQEFSETNEGSELKTWVKLIEEYGTAKLSKAINKLTPKHDADYIVSTAHKAKGLEWGAVQIADDFLYDINKLSVKISAEELRLLYVTCTRAQHLLNTHQIYDLLAALGSKKLIYK